MASAPNHDATLNEQLHMTIYLLTVNHPTAKEFELHFKKNMFAKCNKSAFQHVIHFLLNILDPENFKKKVRSWPIYDVKMEVQFRNEIASYLKELAEQYGEDFPAIQKSFLVSPGGPRFAKFIYELSNFVLFQELSSSTSSTTTPLLLPPKVGNPALTQTIINNLNSITNANLNTCIEMIASSEKTFSANKQIATEICQEIPSVEAQLDSLDSNLLDLKINVDESLDYVEKEMNAFEDEVNMLNAINSTLETCKHLVSVCVDKGIDFSNKQSKINGDEKNTVDILKTLNNLNSKLNQVYLQLTPFQTDVKGYLSVIANLSEKIASFNSITNDCNSNLNGLSDKLNSSS